jgi:hypothetical protein
MELSFAFSLFTSQPLSDYLTCCQLFPLVCVSYTPKSVKFPSILIYCQSVFLLFKRDEWVYQCASVYALQFYDLVTSKVSMS